MIRRYTDRSLPAGQRTAPVKRPIPPTPTPPPPPRPAAPRARRKRGKPRRARKAAFTLLVLLLLAGGGIAGAAAWLDAALHREPILAAYPDRPESGPGTNWLLVGSDSREGLTPDEQQELTTGGDLGTGRTDTILLVHVPRFGSANPTTLVSIPRDSYVPIPGYGRDKINAAFAMGGAPLLVQTLEQATGLRIDHYAEIGFSGFAGLVDALGGVTVCPAESINDPLAGVDLPAGCHDVNGREALGYVRTRATPRADLDRMINQRKFMSALLQRAAHPEVLLNPWRWYTVTRAAAHALTVDQHAHVWDLALLSRALHGPITMLTVPIGEFTYSDAGSVVVWNHEAASELFEALSTDTAVPAAATYGLS